MTGRRLFARRDGLLLGALVLLGVVLLGIFSRRPAGTVAVITHGDQVLLRQDLTDLDGEIRRTFTGDGGRRVEVLLAPDGAQVAFADCPDQICVGTGRITHAGESVLCLPARIGLYLEGSGGADATTY